MRELDLAFKDLSTKDKHLMAQLDLGREELTVKDKQFMAQIGLSTQAQEFAEKLQQMQLDLTNKLAERELRLAETSPQRQYSDWVLENLKDEAEGIQRSGI